MTYREDARAVTAHAPLRFYRIAAGGPARVALALFFAVGAALLAALAVYSGAESSLRCEGIRVGPAACTLAQHYPGGLATQTRLRAVRHAYIQPRETGRRDEAPYEVLSIEHAGGTTELSTRGLSPARAERVTEGLPSYLRGVRGSDAQRWELRERSLPTALFLGAVALFIFACVPLCFWHLRIALDPRERRVDLRFVRRPLRTVHRSLALDRITRVLLVERPIHKSVAHAVTLQTDIEGEAPVDLQLQYNTRPAAERTAHELEAALARWRAV